MANYNRVIMMGNLTRDPEHKQLASGQSVCRLGLASNRSFKNKQTGSMVQEVCFIDVDVWGAQAESCRQYLAKGRPVLIEGRLKLDSWQESDGTKRSKHTIVADRVTFLSASNLQADDAGFGDAGDASLPDADSTPFAGTTAAESDAVRISKPRKAATPKASTASAGSDDVVATSRGEINYKDQAPFEDLPF